MLKWKELFNLFIYILHFLSFVEHPRLNALFLCHNCVRTVLFTHLSPWSCYISRQKDNDSETQGKANTEWMIKKSGAIKLDDKLSRKIVIISFTERRKKGNKKKLKKSAKWKSELRIMNFLFIFQVLHCFCLFQMSFSMLNSTRSIQSEAKAIYTVSVKYVRWRFYTFFPLITWHSRGCLSFVEYDGVLFSLNYLKVVSVESDVIWNIHEIHQKIYSIYSMVSMLPRKFNVPILNWEVDTPPSTIKHTVYAIENGCGPS